MPQVEALKVVTPLAPKEFLETFLTYMGVTQYAEIESEDRGQNVIRANTYTDLFNVYITTVVGHDLDVAKHLIRFAPTISLLFVPSRDGNTNDLQNEMIKATNTLLQKEEGDLALCFLNSQQTVLRRLNGKLVVNSTYYEIWTPERLAMITVPYTIEPIE